MWTQVRPFTQPDLMDDHGCLEKKSDIWPV